MDSIKAMEIVPDIKGIFISRENRFLGKVDISGRTEEAHIHDPGRLSEILYPGNFVLLRSFPRNKTRKTGWDLIAGMVDDRWVLVNSVYHRRISDWLLKRAMIPSQTVDDVVRPEVRLGSSRIDYLLSNGRRKLWIEVKGCSLSRDGVALFPDAPTERGARHMSELIDARRSGDECAIIFLVFAPNAVRFSPDEETDPNFSRMLERMLEEGAGIHPLLFSYDPIYIYYEGISPLSLR